MKVFCFKCVECKKTKYSTEQGRKVCDDCKAKKKLRKDCEYEIVKEIKKDSKGVN